MDKPQRTLTQNAAMHVYFELLAEALNDAGLDVKATLEPGIDVSWTKESVKACLWKPIQKVMTGKLSTTEMNTCDPSDIYLELNKFLGQEHGIYVSWPSKERNPLNDYACN